MNLNGKTDNHNLEAKLQLRRHFLAKYHSDGSARVLDCCQGDGIVWNALRKEFPVARYWGLDVKRKAGRLAMDSVRVLQQRGWTDTIVDIDTYGSPWKHWFALLGTCDHAVTVFLTIGQRVTGTCGALDSRAMAAMGLATLKIPAGFHPKLGEKSVSYCLTSSCGNRIILEYAAEIESNNRNVRYIRARLELR